MRRARLEQLIQTAIVIPYTLLHHTNRHRKYVIPVLIASDGELGSNWGQPPPNATYSKGRAACGAKIKNFAQNPSR